MKLIEYISNQFSHPRGIGGKISTFFMNRLNTKQYKCVMNNLQINKDDTILDIGFGNGKLINELSLNSKGKFYGIDASEDMVSSGNKKYPHIDLRIGNILESPFKNDFFNGIYTINTIYFWEDLNKGLREVKRNLKVNGLFINIFYTKKWLDKIKYTYYGFNKYTLDELKNSTTEAGLEIVGVIEISKGKSYCIISTKKK